MRNGHSRTSRRVSREAMTLAEVLVFSAIGVLLVILLIGLLRTARVQDAANEDHLRALAALGAALERLRADAWSARKTEVSAAGRLRLDAWSAGPSGRESVEYYGDGERLYRNGAPVKLASVSAAAVKAGDVPLVTCTVRNDASPLARSWTATVTVPVLARRQLARKEPLLAAWAAAEEARDPNER